MDESIGYMTLLMEHVRDDQWEARLSWASPSKDKLVGWSGTQDEIFESVVDEVLLRSPKVLLVRVRGCFSSLPALLNIRLKGRVRVGSIT